jgi:hypothetical protein
VPVSKVFDHINLLIITAAPNAANKLPISNNGHSFGRTGISDIINFEFIWVPKRSHRGQSGAKLSGILPFMKFAPFPKVDWPDDSYQNWFKARGPAIQIKEVSCLKDLGQSFFGAKINSVSSSLFPTLQSTESIASITAHSSLSAAASMPMVNIPIDPR